MHMQTQLLAKQLGILGLARRAGALAIGTNGVLEAIRKGEAKLVLVAADASPNTSKQLHDKASFRGVPLQALPLGMHDLGHALGKDHTVAVALLQEGFVTSYRKTCAGQTSAVPTADTTLERND